MLVTSIDAATPISGEDSVYLAFTVDTDYDTLVNQNGFDLFELLNSSGEVVVSLTESGAGNTTWNAGGVLAGSTGFATVSNPDLTVVFRIDQVAEEAFLYINPNLSALESANTPTLSFTGGDFSSLTSNDIDILRYRGGGSSPNTLAYSNIALYTGSDTPFASALPPAVVLDGSDTGNASSNAAPGTLIGGLSMINTNDPTGFTYTVDTSQGDHTYFNIPSGSTNLRTAAWIDAADYTVYVIGSKGDFSVTNDFAISVDPVANDYMAFVVPAEMSAIPVQGDELVGVLQVRDTHASSVGFSITGGRTDLFTLSGGTNLMQVASTDPGPVGTIHYVEVTATNAVATNVLMIAAEVVSGTPNGTIFRFR